MFPSHNHQNGKKYFIAMYRKTILLKAKNCYSYSKAARLYGAMARYKNWFYVWKVLCKTNIIRYYFVAIHPMDTRPHRALKDGTKAGTQMNVSAIYNLHTCAICACAEKTRTGISDLSAFYAFLVTCDTWQPVSVCHVPGASLALMGHERIFNTFPLCANSLPLPWCRVLQLVNDEHYCHIMFTLTSQYQRIPEWWHHLNGHTLHTIGGGHRNVKTNPLPLSSDTTVAQVSALLSSPPTLPCDNDSRSRCWVCYCLCLRCGDTVSHVGSQLITEYMLITHLSD